MPDKSLPPARPYGIVYLATNSANGKKYVGQTVKALKQRIRVHKASRTATAISRALRKYGVDHFSFIVIDTASDRGNLNAKEQAWIAFHDCIAPKGYNLTGGGEGSYLARVNI
jgi:group I intron endonuclease